MDQLKQFAQSAMIANESVTLRPACPDDIPLIAQYIEAMSPEERRLRYLYTTSIEALTDPKRLLQSYGALDYAQHMALVVVTADNKIIGVAHAFGPCDKEDSRYECSYSRHSDYKGKGVGTLLMKGMLEWGSAVHLKGLWADTLWENLRMRRLFELSGFARVHPHPDGEYTLIRYRYDFPRERSAS